ncbi:hypothetical protein [Phenylobacterium hankyongense]|uniref:hypothetical protein n=1 Tax=Phenylobacterium hankyongense TaxID=1813876 RepID=UPI0014022E87|nr:hypothetical protein [Phenylobacterium hankyongense]
MPENKPEQPQIDKFRDLARELECDEVEEAFDERLRKLAPKAPKTEASDKPKP